MKKLWGKLLLLIFVGLYLLPVVVLAAGHSRPPSAPYEKVVAHLGDWHAQHVFLDGRTHLLVDYTGSHAGETDKQVLTFTLSEPILITEILIPYKGTQVGDVTLTMRFGDGRGLFPVFAGNLSVRGYGGTLGQELEHHTLYHFTPEFEFAMGKGTYTLHLDGNQLPVGAFAVRGYNYRAHQRYLRELREWSVTEAEPEKDTDKPSAPQEAYVPLGKEELLASYLQYLEGEDPQQEPAWKPAPRRFVAPAFTLDRDYVIEEIILSTWNNGQGATPGPVRIRDKTRNVVATFRAQGVSQGGVPNGLWVVTPRLALPAGAYTIDMAAPQALDFDEAGVPVFYVGLSVPAVIPQNFTGTYKVWLNVRRTHTLMGPVNETRSVFSLEDYRLTVIDKGSMIELIGKYEGMPFSQNCPVIERSENEAIAALNFGMDLTALPYAARVAANARVTLRREPNGRITIGMAGQGFYARGESADRGADDNTYAISLRGNRVSENLPPFVMAAIAKAYGVGNIPGPDSPEQVAMGMLFPPLAGLVAKVLQDLLRPKEPLSNLSAAQQAMRDAGSLANEARIRANQAMGRGLYTEREARAWQIMADALGASGGDPEDRVSIGDNELPGGADYVAPNEPDYSGYDEPEYEPEEDLTFGKPDVPSEKPAQPALEQPEKERDHVEIAAPAEPEYLEVQVTAGGATIGIVRDPATNQWVNAQTGNPFDLDKHRRDFPQQVRDYREYRRRNEELARSGHSALQQAIAEIEREHQSEFDSIQREINQRRREQLSRDQESLEWEQEHARKKARWGRIFGDAVIGAGEEVAETAQTTARDAVDAMGRAADALATATRTMRDDPEKARDHFRKFHESIEDGLRAAKDKAVGAAKEVYNKPWIAVRGVMETGKAVADTVTDPKKALDYIKGATGIEDFGKSLDPNLSLRERLKHTYEGTKKLGSTLATGGKVGAAIKSGGFKKGSEFANMVDEAIQDGLKEAAKETAKNIAKEVGKQTKPK